MEKIKNILSGSRNDETVGGSNQTTGTNTTGLTGTRDDISGKNQGLTGEGSHFGNTRDTVGSNNPSGFSGQNTSGAGIGNPQSSGYQTSTTTTSGPHSSNLANKADPRVDSDVDGSRTVGSSGAGANTTGYGASSGTGYPGQSTGAQSTTTGSTSHHLDRDAAVGAGGVGLAEHEHHKHGNERGTGIGSTTGAGQPTRAYDSTTDSSGHHLGRDAAVGAGGVGLAEHEHRQHQQERGTGIGSTSGTGFGTSKNTTSSTIGNTDNTGHSGPHQTEVANKLDPTVNTQPGELESAHHHSKQHGGGAEEADTHHHLGRDAAVGAGGVGLAEHEHQKHQNERGTGIGSTRQSTGVHGTTSGVDSTTGQSTGAYNTTTGSSGHHLGRDAAVGAGGVGLAEHEHNKHQQTSTGTGIGSGPAPNTAGPHKQDWLNKLDPRVDANPDKPQTTGHGPLKADSADYTSGTTGSTGTHHYGRDAAVAGGVGGAAYEADKHHHSKTDSGVGGASSTTGTTGATLENRGTTNIGADSHQKDHHYGKDAAIAGGVGGAAYEADKHHKHDKDLTAAEREQKKEHRHELKEEKREEKHEHNGSQGGLLSFLHRDKNKKYTADEEAEFDRQEREHNSHKGRDALGGAAVGTGAYEAEKHHHGQHNTSAAQEGNVNKPLPTAPGNQGVGTGVGTQNALASDNTTSSGHHLGRDAAVGAGGAGLAAHDHNTHAGATPLVEKPKGTDLGDKLHGVARNRGVQGSTGFPSSEGFGTGATGTSTTGTSTTGTTGQHHLGRDTAAVGGAGALAEHEHRKHENVGSSGVGAQTTGISNTGTTSGTGNQHHLGRDAAVGAGGVGLAEHEHRKHEGATGGQYDNSSSGLTKSGNNDGSTTTSGLTGSNQGEHHLGRDAAGVGAAGLVGEHEHRKHEGVGNTSSGLTGTGNQHHNTSSGLTGSNQGQQSHLGRDTAGVGAAGLVGEHEHRKHEGVGNTSSSLTGTGNQYNNTSSGLTGSGNQYDNASSGLTGGTTTSSGDRNRLHKDPPASHPAAQGGVPASGSERERLVGQGEQRLGEDTGVANSHTQGGVNPTSNY